MDSRPLVSVLMPVLKPDPVFFAQAVRGLLAQTCGAWELVIVEDPSGQSAAEMLREVSDPRIRYHANPRRTSLIEQRNRTLALARAETVAMADADDVSMPDRLEKQLRYLNQHPQVGVLGSQLEIIDGQGRILGYRSYPLGHEAILRALPRYNAIAQPAVMARKQVILDAGAYLYGDYPAEDYELWSRLIQRGARFANHPEVLVRYRLHPAGHKGEKLHAILRGTLEVKQRYWRGEMDLPARLRMHLERVLLWLPAPLVLRLFTWTHYYSGAKVSRGTRPTPDDKPLSRGA